jgi:Trypsin-co-occurring domain 1
MTDEDTKWQKLKLSDEDDRQIYLEVLDRGGRQEVGILDSIPFEQVIELIGEIAQGIGNTLDKAKPTKASVELGVEFGLENGQLVGLIARGSGKANLKISLEWERSEPKAGASG